MDKRESRQYISSNPPSDPLGDRRNSFLGRLFNRRRSSSTSEEAQMMMTAGLQRRGSVEQPELASITQRVQQEMPKPKPPANSYEHNIFT